MTTTDHHPTHGVRGPVRSTERALAPDLARGAMLLFIAIANCAGVVFAGEPGAETTPRGAERVLNFLMFTFVHGHAYPVFAIMFGYGMVQLARRQQEAGATPAQARSVLVRRNGWLVAFGLVHGVLLYYGDFLGAYGLVGIVITALLLFRGDKVHRIVLWLWAVTSAYLAVLAVVALVAMAGGSGPDVGVTHKTIESLTAPDYLDAVVDRLHEWPVHTPFVLGFVTIVWLGVWAARRRILEEPAAHVVLLRWVAAVGLGIGFAGSIPQALLAAGWLHVDASAAVAVSTLYGASAMYAGPGYVAVFGLLSIRLSRRPANVLLDAVTALGRRSLSGYLFQSVVWLILFAPYTFALGDHLGSRSFGALGIAVAVWLVSVAGAYTLQRRGRRGPAETMLRRLTYGRDLRTDHIERPTPAGRGHAPGAASALGPR